MYTYRFYISCTCTLHFILIFHFLALCKWSCLKLFRGRPPKHCIPFRKLSRDNMGSAQDLEATYNLKTPRSLPRSSHHTPRSSHHSSRIDVRAKSPVTSEKGVDSGYTSVRVTNGGTNVANTALGKVLVTLENGICGKVLEICYTDSVFRYQLLLIGQSLTRVKTNVQYPHRYLSL